MTGAAKTDQSDVPREFDSDLVARGEQRLRFVELVDCPSCDVVFDGVFDDDSLTVEDMVDPPTGTHTCPQCGHRWTSEATGWSFFSEAG